MRAARVVLLTAPRRQRAASGHHASRTRVRLKNEDAPEVRLAKLETMLAPGAPTPEEVSLIADLPVIVTAVDLVFPQPAPAAA